MAAKSPFLVLLFSFLISGCKTPAVPTEVTPKSIRHSSAVSAAPSVSTSEATVDLPPQSVVVFGGPSGPLEVKLGGPGGVLKALTTDLKGSTGPTPPTPSDTAKGSLVRTFGLAGLVCLLLAGLALWAKHSLAAVLFGIAGVSIPFLGVLVGSQWATHIGIGLVAAAGALVAAWWILNRRHRLE